MLWVLAGARSVPTMGDSEEVRGDAREIHDLMIAAAQGPVRPGWTAILETERIGVIRCCWYGTSARPGGSLILTTDDVVYYQHPGYADDDYRRTERVTTDESIVQRARAVLAQ